MAWRAWSAPCAATSTGSTPIASTIRSAASHQPSSKPPTTMNIMNTANYNWTESINRASEKPGVIHSGRGCVTGGWFPGVLDAEAFFWTYGVYRKTFVEISEKICEREITMENAVSG